MGVPQNLQKKKCRLPILGDYMRKGGINTVRPALSPLPFLTVPPQQTRAISCFLFVIPHPERSRRRRNLLLSLLLQLPLSLPFCLSFRSEAPFPIRLTPTNIRHFDRSCSQHYREQRSGEIRFSLPPDIPTKSSLPLLLGKGGSQDPNRSALSRVEGPERNRRRND